MNTPFRTIAHGCPVWVISFAVAACGGGGGSGGSASSGAGQSSTTVGNTLPPSTGPGDAQGYFPDAKGNVWYYDTVLTPASGASVDSFDTITVTGQTTVIGVLASVFQDTVYGSASGPVDNYYYKNAGGLAYVGTSVSSDTFTTAFVPYVEALFPVAPGTVADITKNGVNLNTDLDGDGTNDTANLTLKAQVVDFETLATAVGRFPNSVRTTTALDGSAILSSTHASVPFTSLITQWSAPGVGLLKQTLSVTVENQTTQQSWQARGYYVNGAGAGLTTPMQLLGSLYAPDSNLYSPGPPALAASANNFLVVSQSSTGVIANLFDLSGTSLSTFTIGGSGGPVAATFDGANYFVVVINFNTIVLHRISPAGVDLDAPNGVNLSVGQTAVGIPSAARGQADTLLVYPRYDNVSSRYLLYGLLVNQNGQIEPVGEIPIDVDSSASHLFPSVSFDGTNFLVAWQEGEGGPGPTAHIYAARINQNGTVLDNPPLVVSAAVNGQFSPAVAYDGSNYLVVWQDGRNAAANIPPSDVYGARVSPGGLLVDGPAATGGVAIDIGGSQMRSNPSVVFGSSNYLVGWSDLGYAVNGATGIRLAQLTPSGTVTTPAGGLKASGAPPASSTSQFAFPVIATQSKAAAIVWLNNSETNAGPGKSILGIMDYSP